MSWFMDGSFGRILMFVYGCGWCGGWFCGGVVFSGKEGAFDECLLKGDGF